MRLKVPVFPSRYTTPEKFDADSWLMKDWVLLMLRVHNVYLDDKHLTGSYNDVYNVFIINVIRPSKRFGWGSFEKRESEWKRIQETIVKIFDISKNGISSSYHLKHCDIDFNPLTWDFTEDGQCKLPAMNYQIECEPFTLLTNTKV